MFIFNGNTKGTCEECGGETVIHGDSTSATSTCLDKDCRYREFWIVDVEREFLDLDEWTSELSRKVNEEVT
jgi:hypothetical protein